MAAIAVGVGNAKVWAKAARTIRFFASPPAAFSCDLFLVFVAAADRALEDVVPSAINAAGTTVSSSPSARSAN